MGQPGGAMLLMMLTMSMVASAALLFWTWLANRNEKLLLLSCLGFLAAGFGTCLIGLRGFVPLAISVVLGNALTIAGTAMLYAGLRVFSGRPFPTAVVIGAPCLFVAAMAVPGIYDQPPLRFSLSSLLNGTIYIMSALEVMGLRDGLRSRLPIGLALILQSIMTLARIPISHYAGPEIFAVEGMWVAAIAVESMIFAQVVSYLVISLPKERADLALQRAALTDSLTGLPNRRAFYETAHQVLSLAARRRHPVSLVLFDLDRFKQLNDTHGHATGDLALMTFAMLLRDTLRDSDFCGRIGGEEFAAILLETGEAEARRAAERVVEACAAEGLVADGRLVALSASAGIACSVTGSDQLEPLFARADQALYAAKAAGRNRVAVAGAAGAAREAPAI